MQNVLELDKLELSEYGLAPLQNSEMEEIDGGLGFWATVAAGVIIAAGTTIMQEWKEVERGFASTQK